MNTTDIVIRDPFILADGGRYYLYGTRSETAWGHGDGFDVYESSDLEDWTGPKEIFHRPDDFWADKEFWAPECIRKGDRYYLIATFGTEGKPKGIQILESGRPDGPFKLLTPAPVTPKDWNCLDGTVYTNDLDESWLVFSHGFPQEPGGAIMAARLLDDMTGLASQPQTLFHAEDAPWTRPIPFAKEEFGLDGDNYFSDGPYLFYNDSRQLCMLWSSWSERGYAMGISVSESGIAGPWHHAPKAAYYGGGHGMVFRKETGEEYVVWHAPNEALKEHPRFMMMNEFADGVLEYITVEAPYGALCKDPDSPEDSDRALSELPSETVL